MATTTPAAIIAKTVQVIEGIVPAHPPLDRPFQRVRAPSRALKRWATEAGGLVMFRLFDVQRVGQRTDLGPLTDETLVNQRFRVTVVYPAVPDLYAMTDLQELEDLIESDAHQIRDAIFSIANLANDGHIASQPTIEEPDRAVESMWFQDISILSKFYVEQKG